MPDPEPCFSDPFQASLGKVGLLLMPQLSFNRNARLPSPSIKFSILKALLPDSAL